MEEIKFWIARDEDETDEDGNVINQGSLHIFYDTPVVADGDCVEMKASNIKFKEFIRKNGK